MEDNTSNTIISSHPTESRPIAAIHPRYDRKFMDSSLYMVLNFVYTTLKGYNKVIDLKLPEQLHSYIDFHIADGPCPESYLISLCEKILQNQVKPYHPHFHNQLFGGFDQYAVAGAMMAPCINGSVFTYEISPCWTLMYSIFYEKMRQLLKWDTIDGTFTPGGSFSNFMSILLARHRALPNCKAEGYYGSKIMKIFTSYVAHYSLKKGVVLCGLGTNNIVSIKCDANGRMQAEELETALLKEQYAGNLLLMVLATVGTTVEGAIDPLDHIGAICRKYNVWLHIDAAFGGGFFMSDKLIGKMGSYKDVDSVTWDPHKALVVPLQATFFICKHVGMMKSCNEAKADYLFHKYRLSYDASLDVGDKSLQCGRVIDILKLWTYFKGNGWYNIARQVYSYHSLALYVQSYVRKHPDQWRLAVYEVDTFNVCFWYIPKTLHIYTLTYQDKEILSRITVYAKKLMIEYGKILIGYSSSRSPHYFWRTVMSNPFITYQDIDYEMSLLAKYTEQSYVHLYVSNQT